jgi:serine/threonine-protein kinase
MADTQDFDAHLRAILGDAYDLERELPGSGMSRVFVATERALGRKVVIKVLPPELAAGVNRERFKREIQLGAQLQHPHIVPLHTAGVSSDLLYFTMPYIEGESLRHAILEHKQFTPREVVRVLHDVADALAYAHARGVIHRDIKPGNVLRSGSHSLVTDFGVAKAISAAMPSVTTSSSGVAIGTPQYMAPEQLAADPAADHRVDIYAVGLLGWELLAGESPFRAPSPQETMAAQLTRVPEPITKRRSDVPPALATLLARCLAKNPADRPQTAAELAAMLDEIDISSGSRPPVHARRVPAWMSLAAVLVVGVAVAGIVRMRSDGAAPSTPQAAAPAPVAPPQAPALTREDSLAIARAVERKYAEQRAMARAEADTMQAAPAIQSPPPRQTQETIDRRLAAIADSLRDEIQRAILDSVSRVRGGRRPEYTEIVRSAAALESLSRLADRFPRTITQPNEPTRFEFRTPQPSPEAFAERAKNMGAARRIFMSSPTLRGPLTVLGPTADSLVDSLRVAVGGNPRFVVISRDTAQAILAKTRNIRSISEALGADLFASLYVTVQPDSTVIWTVTVRDLGAHPAYATRSAVARGMVGTLPGDTDALIGKVVRHLEEMDRAPRRTMMSEATRRP